MDWKLELIVVPVSDVDRAKSFYLEQAGIRPSGRPPRRRGLPRRAARPSGLRLRHRPHEECGCPGHPAGDPPGGRRHRGRPGRAARPGGRDQRDLPLRGGRPGDRGPIRSRADYGSFLSFSDPDGNGWLVQEVGQRPGHLIGVAQPSISSMAYSGQLAMARRALLLQLGRHRPVSDHGGQAVIVHVEEIGDQGVAAGVALALVGVDTDPHGNTTGDPARAAHLAPGPGDLGPLGQTEVGNAGQPLLQGHPQLHAGQVGAGTAVDARPEGDMTVEGRGRASPCRGPRTPRDRGWRRGSSSAPCHRHASGTPRSRRPR